MDKERTEAADREFKITDEPTPERGSGNQADDFETEADRQEKIQEALEKISATETTRTTRPRDKQFLFGDFAGADTNDGRIVLNQEQAATVDQEVTKLEGQDNYKWPSLFSGKKTATTYDSRVTNFSTQTGIINLPDGRRLFAVDCYPSSQIHRWWDAFGKKLCGHRFAKVPSSRWKQTFILRSNIPTMENDDERVVLMPYPPNINLRDLLAESQNIKDFGECPWAEDIDLAGKLEIVDQMVDEVKTIHAQGKTWGETIVNNFIVTKDRQVVLCDPETVYDQDVPATERMARDLRDLVFSSAGSLIKSGEAKDPGQVVDQVLSRYGNGEVIAKVKELVSKKLSLVQQIVYRVQEVGRLGVGDMKNYETIKKAILDYQQ